MASTRNLVLFFTVTLFLRISVDAEFMKPHDLLKDNFYKDSCPNAEAVIRRAVFTAAEKNLKLAAGLIRLQFHDCFVEGCDGSVLLDGNDTEKTAPVNEHLKGFRVVDAAKAAVEEVCPGVVSCADVLAYAARDSTVMLNGTRFEVQGGRKDGLFSCAEAAGRDLPPPTFNASQLIDSFAKRGLSAEQMVVLSGSHTVGVGHCDKFIERLYNFSEAHATDPSLNSTYAKQLKRDCPKRNFNSTLEIFMDTMTPGEIDSNYYVGLTQRKGLFTSDQTLFEDRRTRKFVRRLMNEGRFDRRFGEAMRAMGAVGVQFEGQIRKNCRKVNEE